MKRRGGVAKTRIRGVLILLALGLIVLVSYDTHVPLIDGNSGHTVRAAFTELNDVNSSTPVRVDGVNVGTVTGISRGTGEQSIVTMNLGNAAVLVHSNATAAVRYRTVLGGSVYVDLSPGTPSAPALGDHVLPVTQTSMQVEFDDVSGQFTTSARRGFGQTLEALAAGFSDPAGIAATLKQVGPDLQVIGQASELLRGTDIGDLPGLVRGLASTLNAVAGRDSDLLNLVDSSDAVLGVTNRESQALAQAIQLTPAALASISATEAPLDHTLTRLDTLAVALRPGAAELRPAISHLQPTLATANTLLNDVPPVSAAAPAALEGLRQLSDTGVPLITGLSPALLLMNTSTLPWLRTKTAETNLRNYEVIGPLAAGADSAAGEYDANGHIVKEISLYAANSVIFPCDTGPLAANVANCNLLNDVFDLVTGGQSASSGGH